ncbi:DUF4126 family protein [Mycobacterium sp. 1274756.6]|uniref:DUF4126 family protein n=1 Tax=Mycobacterium sp. 1274756.6 TaxID=1834076 RepID=UPI0007FFA7E3|nr:DUF4126 family protein [Mycobacterium sp. 1274756.6]OBJ73644.1 DUF4126 domain-containing protein [Mycobacterium sp. 1274756.6]
MTQLMVLSLALLIGVIAGLRALTAPAVVSWAAMLGWIGLDDTWASWVGQPVTVVLLTLLAVTELVGDKLPGAPDRTIVAQFAARLLAGAFAGTVLGTVWGYRWSSLGAGLIGAVLGTLGGYAGRQLLINATGGRRLTAGSIEDGVAVLGGVGVLALAAAG